jgi:hypothetical protein
MKFSVLAATAAASALAFAMPAAAQDEAVTGAYGNLGYSFVDGGDSAQFGAVGARIGYRFHTYFGAEAEGAIGVDGDRATFGAVTIKTELKHSVAAYGVGFLPVSPNFDLLARVGYGSSKVKASSAGVSSSDSDDSWNYGVGAQYLFDGANGVRADYTRHDFGHGADSDVWTVAYVRKF